jgi:hypothetical protein
VFDGAANLDEISFPTKGWSGLTLRLYDSDSDQWALYWVSDAASRIDPPVVGRWNDRREFVGYCDDTFEGRPVLVRFIWNGISETTAHWEQAFSIDGGQTWETNWVMDSTRVIAVGPAGSAPHRPDQPDAAWPATARHATPEAHDGSRPQ